MLDLPYIYLLILSFVFCVIAYITNSLFAKKISSTGSDYYFFMMVQALVCGTTILIISGGISKVSSFSILFGVLFGAVCTFQTLTYLKALSIGPFSYTTVMVSLSTVIPTLSGLFWGETISVAQIIDGEKIGFAPKAELYDEQPVNFKQSWNQRLRWSKGYYQVFGKYGKGLIKGMFKGNFSCFDMSMTIMPAAVLSILAIFCNIVLGTLILIGNGATREFFHLLLNMLWGVYGTAFIIGAITTVTEWKKINLGVFRKIFYMFTFPLFMLTYIPITIVAIFKKVKWTPIKHHGSKSNLRKSKKEKVG